MKNRFVCQDCGSAYSKWTGRCDGCGAWNRILEEAYSPRKTTSPATTVFTPLDGTLAPPLRLLTGIEEFDRVCGGGLVPGSVILVGGDPGIGKSTLLLQITAALAPHQGCAYVSGEEALDQVRIRAGRLQAHHARIHFAATSQVEEILQGLEQLPNLRVVVVDSIQTMVSRELDSTAGTVGQVRASAQEFINFAKRKSIAVILVGHVTKEGVLAGPRVLEHMVDTVLYFEGDRTYHYRLLRAVKNRFGPSDEIGVFTMNEEGLEQVTNPSAFFLAEHNQLVSGSAIFAGIEGTRPILCEIQALVAPTYLPSPRRTVVGWDSGRLAMVLAVLEARCRVNFNNRDVFLNVAGGLRLSEPAADLAAAAALISALNHRSVPPGSCFFGEVGLGGEVRPVRQIMPRLREAQKLGFTSSYGALTTKNLLPEGINFTAISFLQELVEALGGKPDRSSTAQRRN